MNKTEARFHELLFEQKVKGNILDFEYERIKLKLADATFYTPDFVVYPLVGNYTDNPCLKFIEVKGPFIRDDAMVKFKVAKEMFKHFDFEMWQLKDSTWRRIK